MDFWAVIELNDRHPKRVGSEEMMKNDKRSFFTAKTIAQLGLYIALMLVLSMTSLGYLPLGPINVTTMHIPVLIGATLGGWKYGMILGAFFGFNSFFQALQGGSGVLSFIFMNPIISVLPRIAFGTLAGLLADRLRGRNDFLAHGFPALAGSLINTILVMGLIYIIYAEQYMAALGLSRDMALKTVLSVCFVNGVPEAIVATIVSLVVCKAVTLKNRGRTYDR